MYNFFIHPKSGLQKILTLSPVDHPPISGLKMTNPLVKLFLIFIYFKFPFVYISGHAYDKVGVIFLFTDQVRYTIVNFLLRSQHVCHLGVRWRNLPPLNKMYSYPPPAILHHLLLFFRFNNFSFFNTSWLNNFSILLASDFHFDNRRQVGSWSF